MLERIRRLQELLAGCPAQEQPGFRRRLAGLTRGSGRQEPSESAVTAVERDIVRSSERRAARAQRVPPVTYPDDLPVAQARDRIRDALVRHQVVIVSGDTGSGKTTQLPKICLEAGRGVDGLITMTQPRRIAARSVAARIAAELQTTLGGTVGFKVRFDDRTSEHSLVRVVTDGVLLAEIERDPLLLRSDTVIVDEAHERSLNIDFLLGYLKRLLPKRPDLKVIVASATIDVDRFSEHFGNAPVVQVDGRLHPIETRWRPLDDEASDSSPAERAVKGVEECLDSGPGDILVFLSGERDIQDAADALSRVPAARGVEVLPLYARLPVAEQDRVFHVGRSRRIILATNVAETSVTVPGIRFVVDTGIARIARWSGRTRVLRLPVEPIARASADQRKGRCGRVGPGVCIRLYSEEDFLAREPFTAPELLRTNLANVILQMKALGLGEIAQFPFLETPSPRLVAEGLETLAELGAVDRRGDLTALGKRMATLPVDPRLARTVLAAIDEGALAEGLVIAAALSIQDPRERPAGQGGAADFAQLIFRDQESDFLSLLKLWRRWRTESAALGSSALRRWCREHFISHQRMREWAELHEQLRSMVSERLGMRAAPLADACDANRIHRAMLAGFVSQLGFRGEDGEYRTATGGRFAIFPGSTLARRTPNWVVAAEIVETSRRFGRTLARVQGDWVERIAPHLVERIRSEPHWVRATGQVAAWERVQFGELTIVPRRRVPWGPVQPEDARNIFIQCALVDGDCDLDAPFIKHNHALRLRIEAMEAKRRERGLLVDSEARFAFFDARVPTDVHSIPSFERWRRRVESRDSRTLFMRESDLLASTPDADMSLRFPDAIDIGGGASADLRYELSPGTALDGIHARIAIGDLGSTTTDRLEWLVPGLLAEKIEALIRTLPKRLRVRLFPLREVAEAAAETIPFAEGSILESVAAHLAKVAGMSLTAGDFDRTQLPPHLRLHIEVVSDAGDVLAAGDDIAALRRSLAPKAAAHREGLLERAFQSHWNRSGLRTFDLDELPDRIEATVDGLRVVAWPMLVDGGDSVSLGLAPDAEAAERSTRLAMRTLHSITARDAIRHHLEYASGFQELLMTWLASTRLGREPLMAALVSAVAGRAFVDDRPIVRTPAEFEARVDQGAAVLSTAVQEVVRAALALHTRSVEVLEAIDGPMPSSWRAAVDDIARQRQRLAAPDALARIPWQDVQHLIRYVAALGLRARKLRTSGPERDAVAMIEVARWEDEMSRAEAALAAEGRGTAAIAPFRMLLEEYRVSLFAQELRTSIPISAERLERAWRDRGQFVQQPSSKPRSAPFTTPS